MKIRALICSSLLAALCCSSRVAAAQATPTEAFQATPFTIPAGTLAFGDFNGDGKPDAVSLDAASSSIFVYLGNDDGTFATTPLITPVSGNPAYSFSGSKLVIANVHNRNTTNLGLAFSVSQFNSSGKLQEYGVILADGTGNGYFGLCENDIICLPDSPNYTAAPNILMLVADAFLPSTFASSAFAGNTDIAFAAQFPDLTTSGTYDNSFFFYLGDGYGGLSDPGLTQDLIPATVNATTPNPSAMPADFLNNGYPDLLVNPGFTTSNNVNTPTGLTLGVNNLDGSFSAGTNLLTGTAVAQYLPIDVNADKKLDIAYTETVATGSPSTSVKALIGDGAGHFGSPVTLVSAPSGLTGTLSFSFVDVNSDGILDIVFSGQSAGIYWAEGTATGTYETPALVTASDTLSAYSVYPQPPILGSKTNFVWGQKAGYVIVPPAALLINPSETINFGTQFVGSTSAPQPVTLTNTGGQPLTISSIAASTSFAETDNCSDTLAPGASCTVQVTFTPTATGPVTGTLSVTNSTSSTPQVANLSGTGTNVTIAAASGSSTTSSITSGGTATYVLDVNPVSGFTGPLTVSCTGAPSGYQCVPSATTVTVNASPATVTLTVGPSTSAASKMADPLAPVKAIAFAGVLIFFIPRKHRGRFTACMLVFVGFAAFSGCGGKSGSPITNPVSNTYTLTATFTTTTGQSITQKLNLTITSQSN